VQKRSKSAIAARSAAEARAGDIALPPLRKGRNTEAEKSRLQVINQFKGGKGGGLTAVAALEGEIPLTLLNPTGGAGWGRPPAATAAPPLQPPGGGDSDLLRELRRTYAAVARGMEEAAAFADEMRALGASTAAVEAKHAAEVLGAGRELARLQGLINRELAATQQERPLTVGSSSAPDSPPQHHHPPEGGRGGGGGGGGGGSQRGSPTHALKPPRAFGEGDMVGGGFRVFSHGASASPPKVAVHDFKTEGLGVFGASPTKGW